MTCPIYQAVLLVPRDSVLDILYPISYSTSPSSLTWQLIYLTRQCLAPQAPQEWIERLEKLVEKALELNIIGSFTLHGETSGTTEMPTNTVENILRISLQHGRFNLFEKVAQYHQGHLPLGFFDWMRQCLAGENLNQAFPFIEKG